MKKQVLICTVFLFVFANVVIAQKMTVKDSDSNVLMEVNDEGTLGSITLPSGAAPSTTTNKLYNGEWCTLVERQPAGHGRQCWRLD